MAARDAGGTGGEAYVVDSLPPPTSELLQIREVAAAIWSGPHFLLPFRYDKALKSGDIDGTGDNDLFVSAPLTNQGPAPGTAAPGGRAWIVTNPLDGGDLDRDAHAIFGPTYANDAIGEHATFGDFDGDGQDDIAIAHSGADRAPWTRRSQRLWSRCPHRCPRSHPAPPQRSQNGVPRS